VNHRILLADDDVEFVEALRDYLCRDGFIVDCVPDGEAALTTLAARAYDAVVLDVMMPRVNGIEALAAIRKTSALPVVMLTARGDDDDRITGLELGADDYVPKPCRPRELAARLRSILRRAATGTPAANDAIAAGPLTLWPRQRRSEVLGQPLELTSTELSIVMQLVRQAGHLVTREDISREALGRPFNRYDRAIDVHVSRIRQKLGQFPEARVLIRTVIHKGYQLVLD
jgi:DNA-binding response OmpR family regulator